MAARPWMAAVWLLAACGGASERPAGAGEPPASESAPQPQEVSSAVPGAAGEAGEAGASTSEGSADGSTDGGGATPVGEAAEGGAPGAGSAEASGEPTEAAGEAATAQAPDEGRVADTPSDPEDWPAWKPTHSIQLLVVEDEATGDLLQWSPDGRHRLEGQISLAKGQFEMRGTFHRSRARARAERVLCTWEESGTEVTIGCSREHDDDTITTKHTLARGDGGFTLEMAEPPSEDNLGVPRKIVAKKL